MNDILFTCVPRMEFALDFFNLDWTKCLNFDTLNKESL